uniref:Putative ribonuclease n=1 Tax=Panstrongylus lignarius TaxID=156445 RepID=A0A224XUX9_9HEMI
MIKIFCILFGIIFTGATDIANGHGKVLQDELTYEGFDEFENQEEILKKHFNNKEWDALIFTQTWPPSDCISWRQSSKRNKCRNLGDTKEEQWTIHGIWPTKWGTHGPMFCDRSKVFDLNTVHDLMTRMKSQWAPIEESGNGIHFWRHEWDKHGTCAAQLPELGTPYKYILQALTWNTRYNLKKWLSTGSITAGKDYELSEIWEIINHESGVDPHIICFKDNKKNKNYLKEIRLCFDKKLSLIDCKPISGKKTGNISSLHSKILSHTYHCDFDLPVVYPSSKDVQPTFYYM